jgi:hypothetical protein
MFRLRCERSQQELQGSAVPRVYVECGGACLLLVGLVYGQHWS